MDSMYSMMQGGGTDLVMEMTLGNNLMNTNRTMNMRDMNAMNHAMSSSNAHAMNVAHANDILNRTVANSGMNVWNRLPDTGAMSNMMNTSGDMIGSLNIISNRNGTANLSGTNMLDMSGVCNNNPVVTEEKHGFICQRCGKTFSSESELKSHEATQCRELPYSCIYCDRRFRAIEHMRVHVRIHTGERPFECQQCGKRFTQTSHLRSHELTHTGVRPYVCVVCDKTFKQKEHLKTHERVHTGLRPYSCTDCGKTFAQSSHLRSHQHIHTNTRPYSCVVCSKTFAQSEHLRGHMRTHTGERPFRCEQCGKTFAHSASLRNHEAVHRGRLFPCIKCGPTVGDFGSMELLNEHENELHNGKRQYECRYCDKSYSFLSGLRTHEKFHMEGKPHVCEFCQKAFRQFEHLRVHKRTHTGERPFACRFCDKKFAQSPHLRTHERLYHREECAALIGQVKTVEPAGDAVKRKGNKHLGLPVRISPRLLDKSKRVYREGSSEGGEDEGEVKGEKNVCDACGAWFGQKSELVAHLHAAHGTGGIPDGLNNEHLEECDEEEINRMMYNDDDVDDDDDDDDDDDNDDDDDDDDDDDSKSKTNKSRSECGNSSSGDVKNSNRSTHGGENNEAFHGETRGECLQGITDGDMREWEGNGDGNGSRGDTEMFEKLLKNIVDAVPVSECRTCGEIYDNIDEHRCESVTSRIPVIPAYQNN